MCSENSKHIKPYMFHHFPKLYVYLFYQQNIRNHRFDLDISDYKCVKKSNYVLEYVHVLENNTFLLSVLE